jgi:hypothetical protein
VGNIAIFNLPWYLVDLCGELHLSVYFFRIHKPVDFDLDNYLGSAWQMERGKEYVFRIRFWGAAAIQTGLQ